MTEKMDTLVTSLTVCVWNIVLVGDHCALLPISPFHMQDFVVIMIAFGCEGSFVIYWMICYVKKTKIVGPKKES